MHPYFTLESISTVSSDNTNIAVAMSNLQQYRLQGEEWLSNARENFKVAERWVNELTIKTPVVVMAAGASLLCRYKEVLNKHTEAKIIAVDRSLDFLNYVGIIPEYVVCKDANPVVASFIERVQPQTKVLVSLQCDVSVAQMAKDKGCEVYFFGSVNPTAHTAKVMYAEFGEWIGMIADGSVVTFDACDFAIQAGSKEIILLGNDLRYYTKQDAVNVSSTQGELRNFGDNSYSTKIFHEASGCFNALPKMYPDVKFISYSTVPTLHGEEVKLFLDRWENK